jgi:hypothetical protein
VHCYEPDEEVFGIHPTQRIPGEDGTILIFIYNSLDELEDLHVHSNLLRGYFILCYAKALLPELILTHKYIFFFNYGTQVLPCYSRSVLLKKYAMQGSSH